MVAIEKVLPTSAQMDTTDPSSWHKGECDEIILKNTIQKHFKLTGSARAGEILENWDRERQHFVKVFPHEYRRALGEMHEKAQQNQRKEQTV
jgi:glutamate synthase domain-containing protein 3